MIWGTWLDPNFRFDAVDRDGVSLPFKYLCHAGSKDELRRRLEAAKLTVKSIEAYDFADWKRRAQAAAQKAYDAHLANEADPANKKAIPFTSRIWQELKWHLFDLFHGKCAYCESKGLASSYGQVEHYRPKAKVDEDPTHPGYYWLAYEVTNLLPSCGPCNEANGKMTHFPILGARARDANGLAGEVPLLLNPLNHNIDPFEHLEFSAFGEVTPRNASLYGESSRRWYHLNRPDLISARQEALNKVEVDWSVMTSVLANLGFEYQYKSLLAEISIGKRPYSAAQRWHLERITKRESGEILPAEVEGGVGH